MPLLRSMDPALILFSVCAALVGCGPATPQVYHLSGNVMFEGAPVANGTITFVSEEPSVVDDFAPIDAQGNYQAQVKAGKKKIVIHATREEGEVDPVMGSRPLVAYLPPEYSTAALTKLTLDVSADGTHDFHLVKP